MNYSDLHQTPEQIVKAAKPAQRILWNYIFLTFGERASLSQLFYQGVIAGSDFLTFRDRRIYVAYELSFNNGTVSTAAGVCTLFNEANAVSFSVCNTARGVYWDVTAAAVVNSNLSNNLTMRNVYFSRFVSHVTITYMVFNGFRVTF